MAALALLDDDQVMQSPHHEREAAVGAAMGIQVCMNERVAAAVDAALAEERVRQKERDDTLWWRQKAAEQEREREREQRREREDNEREQAQY